MGATSSFFCCEKTNGSNTIVNSILNLVKGNQNSIENIQLKIESININIEKSIDQSSSIEKSIIPSNNFTVNHFLKNINDLLVSNFNSDPKLTNLVSKIIPKKANILKSPLFNCLNDNNYKVDQHIRSIQFATFIYTLPCISNDENCNGLKICKGEYVYNFLCNLIINDLKKSFNTKLNNNKQDNFNKNRSLYYEDKDKNKDDFPLDNQNIFNNLIETDNSDSECETRHKSYITNKKLKDSINSTVRLTPIFHERKQTFEINLDSGIPYIANLENGNIEINSSLIKKFFFFYAEVSVINILSNLFNYVKLKLSNKNTGKNNKILYEKIIINKETASQIQIACEKFSLKNSLLLYEKLLENFFIALKETGTKDYKKAFISISNYFDIETIAEWCLKQNE